MVIRRGKPLAVALFGVIALAILVACGGGGTTESAKSSDPQTASGSDSPLAVLGAVTKAIESKVGEQKNDPGSAIAALIQSAESQTAPLAEAIKKRCGTDYQSDPKGGDARRGKIG